MKQEHSLRFLYIFLMIIMFSKSEYIENVSTDDPLRKITEKTDPITSTIATNPTIPTIAGLDLSNLPTIPSINLTIPGLPTFAPLNLSNLPTLPPVNMTLSGLPTLPSLNLENLPTLPQLNLSLLEIPTFAPLDLSNLTLPGLATLPPLNLGNMTLPQFNFSLPEIPTFAPLDLSNLTLPGLATIPPLNLGNLTLPQLLTIAPIDMSNLPTIPAINLTIPEIPTIAPLNLSLTGSNENAINGETPPTVRAIDGLIINSSPLSTSTVSTTPGILGDASGDQPLDDTPMQAMSLQSIVESSGLPDIELTEAPSISTNSSCSGCADTEVCAIPFTGNPECIAKKSNTRYCSDDPCDDGMNCFDNTTSHTYTCYTKLDATAGECLSVKCSVGAVCYQIEGEVASCIPRKYSPTCNATNEEYSSCLSGCDGSCDDPIPSCTNSTTCTPGCSCIKGFVRINGQCELMDMCDSKSVGDVTCDGTEEYTDCMPSCEQSCDGKELSCQSNSTSSDSACKPGCVCRKGYKRDDSGQCVHDRKCFKNTKCGENEEWSKCHNCEQVCGSTTNKRCKKCWSGCSCSTGFARNSSGICISEDQC